MKKTLSVLMMILTAQAMAAEQGQSSATVGNLWSGSSSQLHITPMVGVAAMAIKTNNQGDSDTDVGASMGGLVEFGLGAVDFQTGLIYNQFGGRKDVGSGIDAKFTFSYLSVPLLTKFNFMGDAQKTVYLKAGLMPGFLTSKNLRVSAMGQSATTSSFTAGSFDLPVVIGVGGAIPVSSMVSIVIEANYVRSLIDYDLFTVKARNEGVIVNAGASIAL